MRPFSLRRIHRFVYSMPVMLLVCGALSAAALKAQSGASTAAAPSLYERLGGYDEIARFIGLVFPRVAQHPELTHLFRGHGRDSQQRQFQLVVELICQKTGGPCAYIGRPMPPVHDGLGITDEHWATFMTIIMTGMTERGYAARERDDFLEVWRAFRTEVVDPAAR